MYKSNPVLRRGDLHYEDNLVSNAEASLPMVHQ